MIDVLATEPHFVDHLAPIWLALPGDARGSFIAPGLGAHARARGIDQVVRVVERGDRPTLVSSYGDHKRARVLGRRQHIARIEHGIGQSYKGRALGNYAGGRDADDVSLFLTPNEYSAERWRARYPVAEVVVVGSPRLDRRPLARPRLTGCRTGSPGSPGGSTPVVAVSFHWNCTLYPETRSSWSYYQASLGALVDQGYQVIGHGHPRIYDRLVPTYRRLGIEPVDDLEQVLDRADVYVCDNSSSMYEAATRMPVVVLNAPWYRRSVNHGLRFWEAADVGVQVDRPDQLVDAVARALDDEPGVQGARKRALELVYTYLDGRSSERAADALVRWSTKLEPLAWSTKTS